MTVDQDAPVHLDHRLLEELLIRCAAADEAAFAEYYRLTSPVLNALVRTRGFSREAGEDVLVRSYVLAWHRAPDFDRGSTGSAWSWTLAVLEQALAAPGPDLGDPELGGKGRPRTRGPWWGRSRRPLTPAHSSAQRA